MVDDLEEMLRPISGLLQVHFCQDKGARREELGDATLNNCQNSGQSERGGVEVPRFRVFTNMNRAASRTSCKARPVTFER